MKISSNRSSAAACLQPGDKVHIKFADTNLYLCEVPDYNGYAAVAGSALAKATFKVELNSCYDACITEPAGERTQFFELGTQFIQLRHLGTDDGRRFKLKGWRYYYHATTSSGKYDTHRPDNSKQFFLINGTDTTVEYGKRCKLLDVAYFGTTCVRMQDKVKRAIKIIGPAPQYWLSAKYASTIEKCHPMYHDDIVFELAVDQCRSSAVLVPSDQEEVTTPDESYEHYTHDDQADLEKPTTITIKELTKFNLPFGAVVDRAWYGVRGKQWTQDQGMTVTDVVKLALASGTPLTVTKDAFGQDPAPGKQKVLCMDLRPPDILQKQNSEFVCPGHRVHIKFANTNVYLCDVPDYNGYAAAAGPAAAKATFEIELNPCFDQSIAEPAGDRKHAFKVGDSFIQLKHLGVDEGRTFPLRGWRYYYHATTSTGKYDKKRSDNSKQFFLIDGLHRTVEYGKKCKLIDIAYYGITCYRKDDSVDTSIRLTGSSPQYWLSAKYASTIQKCQPMYCDDIVFESATQEVARGAPSVQGRKVVGNAGLWLFFGLIRRSGAELDNDETLRLQEIYQQIRNEAEEKRLAAIQNQDGPLTATALLVIGTVTVSSTSINDIANRCCEAAVRAGELQVEQLLPGSFSDVYKSIGASIWIGLTCCILILAWDFVFDSLTPSCLLSVILPILIPYCTYNVALGATEAQITNRIRSACALAVDEQKRKSSPVAG